MGKRAWRFVGLAALLSTAIGFSNARASQASSSPPASSSTPVFGLRWSAAVGGELVDVEHFGGVLYVTTLDGSNLDVSAYELDDGTLRWQSRATDAARESPGYSAAVTDRGLLLTFHDAEQGHLMLLDAETGEVRWDDELDSMNLSRSSAAPSWAPERARAIRPRPTAVSERGSRASTATGIPRPSSTCP